MQEWWFCGSETPVSSTGTKYSPLACSADPEIDSMARKVAELLEVTGIDLEGKAAPYMLLLSIMGIFTALVVWKCWIFYSNHLGVEFCAP